MDGWWYVEGDERKGPVSDDDLRRLLTSGKVAPTTLVWMAGMQSWEPLAQVPALASMRASLPPDIPAPRAAPQETKVAGWRRHLGSTVALVLGALLFFAGTSAIAQGRGPSPDPLGGLVMILGALAYRSAKKRKLGEVKSTLTRRLVEALIFPIFIYLIVLNPDKPGILIPSFGAMVAYFFVFLTPASPGPSETAHQAAKTSQLGSLLAYLAALVAISLGIGWLIHGGEGFAAGDFAYVIGQAVAASLVASLAVVGIAKSTKKPIRWDIAFAFVACFLLFTNRQELLEAYDARQLIREVRSGGPAEVEKTITNSTTQMGVMLRSMVSNAQEANTKISAIFAELDDPLLEDALTLETLGNPDAISRARKMAEEKVKLTRTAMQRIDAALANQLQQDKQLADGFSGTHADTLIQRVEDRYALHRSLYQRQVDLYLAVQEEITATLAFVSSRAGSYRIENDGINFASTEDAETYNAHVSKLQAIAAQQEQLDKDMQAEQKAAAAKLWVDPGKDN